MDKHWSRKHQMSTMKEGNGINYSGLIDSLSFSSQGKSLLMTFSGITDVIPKFNGTTDISLKFM